MVDALSANSSVHVRTRAFHRACWAAFASVATMTVAPSLGATTFRHIDGVNTTIDPATWDLTDNGVVYAVKTKPVLGTPGMKSPWLDSTDPYLPSTKAIAFSIDSGWPSDTFGLQKLLYRLMKNDEPNAASVLNGATRFSGFALRFDPSYETQNGTAQPIGTMVWQCWMGSGWPPLQLRTDESEGRIRLHFVASNDNCRGEMNQYTSVLVLKEPSGADMVFRTGQWYRFVIEFRFDYKGTQGVVRTWVDDSATPAVDWSGQVGYTPASVGGQAGTQDSVDTDFGMYQSDTKTNHLVYFARVRYADSRTDADPGPGNQPDAGDAAAGNPSDSGPVSSGDGGPATDGGSAGGVPGNGTDDGGMSAGVGHGGSGGCDTGGTPADTTWMVTLLAWGVRHRRARRHPRRPALAAQRAPRFKEPPTVKW
jgi:hypothetical protein